VLTAQIAGVLHETQPTEHTMLPGVRIDVAGGGLSGQVFRDQCGPTSHAAANWVKNEVDYLLLRSPVPVQGGSVYSITFGADRDPISAWSIDAARPN